MVTVSKDISFECRVSGKGGKKSRLYAASLRGVTVCRDDKAISESR